MNRKRAVLIALTALLALMTLSFTTIPMHSVKKVFDGDTILLKNGSKIRYLGIDSPEMGDRPEFMAVEAMGFNRSLVSGNRVRLEFDKVPEDRYGRKLCYVFLENNEMVNELLVRKGLAHVLATGPDIRYFSRLLESQRRAMHERVGIWGREVPSTERGYSGNSGSLVFHRLSCARAKEISRLNRAPLKDRWSAFWEGYHPCRICRP